MALALESLSPVSAGSDSYLIGPTGVGLSFAKHENHEFVRVMKPLSVGTMYVVSGWALNVNDNERGRFGLGFVSTSGACLSFSLANRGFSASRMFSSGPIRHVPTAFSDYACVVAQCELVAGCAWMSAFLDVRAVPLSCRKRALDDSLALFPPDFARFMELNSTMVRKGEGGDSMMC